MMKGVVHEGCGHERCGHERCGGIVMSILFHFISHTHTPCRVLAIYDEYTSTLDAINASDDLKWYSVHHGAEMSYSWPQFEV